MSPRWSWDFEEETPPATGGAERRRRSSRGALIRRRRVGALLLVAAVIALVAVLADSGSPTARPRASAETLTRRPAASSHIAVDAARRERDAVAHVFGYTPFVKEGGTRGRDVALTFDDGPGPYTPRLLTVLEHFHVRATFFEIGKMLRYFGESTMREVKDGDVVGDHTETHPQMAQLDAHAQYEELFEQIARVELQGAPRPTLFRPPYGSFDATTMRQLARLHLLMVLWSVDTDDYLKPGVAQIVQRALAGAHAGAIILMHDAGGDRTQTIEALPKIITGLRKRGYRLVTVPELLADDPPPAGLPLPPNLSGD
jgi:peptidoglycan/xylan/chitin deacetylase (PgdA/CDA1 family)